jgi:hypothetical protein
VCSFKRLLAAAFLCPFKRRKNETSLQRIEPVIWPKKGHGTNQSQYKTKTSGKTEDF